MSSRWLNDDDTGDSTTIIGGSGGGYVAGSGIALNGAEIVNTAQDETIVLTGSGTTSISGSYPNFTINSSGIAGEGEYGIVVDGGLTLVGSDFRIDPSLKVNYDAAYNAIISNYVKTASVVGETLTLTLQDNSTVTLSNTDNGPTTFLKSVTSD